MTVIRWYHRHFVLYAELHESLDDALDTACAGEDYGFDSLQCIEVLHPGQPSQVMSLNEVLRLMASSRERQRVAGAAMAAPVARLRLISPGGELANYDSFDSVRKANAEAERLESLLGPRVVMEAL